ncbi:hypothetical protein G6F58_012903 [Rhizopus delemar]|nr:hypothetical protein G6F58_012903 [Rhizopus delemar]
MPGNLEVVVATGGGDRQHVMQGQAQFAGDGVVAAMAVAGHRGGTEYRAVGQAYIRRVVPAFTAALDNRSEAGVAAGQLEQRTVGELGAGLGLPGAAAAGGETGEALEGALRQLRIEGTPVRVVDVVAVVGLTQHRAQHVVGEPVVDRVVPARSQLLPIAPRAPSVTW